MVFVFHYVLCKYDEVCETFIEGNAIKNCAELEYSQAGYVENGDDDDDNVYDYAPAA
ncbi:hypothetical protein AALP_AA4G084000 [Arabis alpina]|uniref:Uncharacterized protein n=1 Tax=Arabis alpina TaxID=50452 RepID=A0A087H1Z6_ARAAL|nr:hypothetical protein AALP_AA4G084000 [Arabis alpina]